MPLYKETKTKTTSKSWTAFLDIVLYRLDKIFWRLCDSRRNEGFTDVNRGVLVV